MFMRVHEEGSAEELILATKAMMWGGDSCPPPLTLISKLLKVTLALEVDLSSMSSALSLQFLIGALTESSG
jgi:hypothetical protein